MKKIFASILVAAASLFGLVGISQAGATPVSCGWWQSHTSTIVYQCVQDGNHKIVNQHENIGGTIYVTTVYNAWEPSWLKTYFDHGNFAGVPAKMRLCQHNPTNPSTGSPLAMYLNVLSGGSTAGWEARFERVMYFPSNGVMAYQAEGDVNHFRGWPGNQAFGSQQSNVSGACAGYAGYLEGNGTILTLG